MMFAFYTLTSLAIVIMIIGLVMAIRVRRIAPGGTIGRVNKIIIVFIVLFLGGYLVAPFLPFLPDEAGLLLVGGVFFFGAIYVVLVLWLIGSLVGKVLDELRFDKWGRSMAKPDNVALHDALDRSLAPLASEFLMTNLHRLIDDAGSDPAELEAAFKRIQVSIKLFIEEKLAQNLAAELRRLVGVPRT